MFGFSYLKSQPTDYVIQHANGRLRKHGPALSLWYHRQTSSVAIVNTGSVDVPFIFQEATADFQTVSIQGQLTYRVSDPVRVATLLNHTVRPGGREYVTDDPDKLGPRLINLTQVKARNALEKHDLRSALQSGQTIANAVTLALRDDADINALGVAVLALVITAIRPSPEMGRALEATAREALLQESDNATYARRQAALEQERRIKENELAAEVALEQRKREVREVKVEAERVIQAKQQQAGEQKLQGEILLEQQRLQLAAARADIVRQEAQAQAQATEAGLRPLAALDARTLELLLLQHAAPGQLLALAAREFAANANKIGNINITPDLLSLLREADFGLKK